MIEKNLSFTIKVDKIRLEKEYMYAGVQIEYSLLENIYKKSFYKTPLEPIRAIEYSGVHTLQDLSENMISQYVDQPLTINLWAEIKEPDEDELTIRND